jgi:hypothetical protein
MTRIAVRALTLSLLLFLFAVAALAQSTGALRGQVTDPSGAVIAEATVTAKSAAGQAVTAATNHQGVYEIKGLAPGDYALSVTAKGFARFMTEGVTVAAGAPKTLDVSLEIQVAEEHVNVQDENTTVDTAASNNASAIVLKGKDLDALSDDPDQLADDLAALAGPSAGPNGGQIYIDGFSNGTLPPKSAIREVRINQNPFSAEFDHIGFGRIEIFTKPGQDKFRGSFMTNLNNSVLNSRNPFNTGVNPGYHSEQFSANFSGPISKKASFFFNTERRGINDSSIINAWVLDSSFVPTNLQAAVLHPQTRLSLGPRIDYQVSKNNTLTARYRYSTNSRENDGIGGYSLASQASNRDDSENELQISDSHVINTTTVNDLRFEYERQRSSRSVKDFAPTINVQEAFTDGGNNGGFGSTHEDNIELQEMVMQTRGPHILKYGGRLRRNREATESNAGYNGTFSFANIDAYALVQQGIAAGMTPAQIRANCVAGLGANPAPAKLLNCGANQFTITAGIPAISIAQTDLGVFFSDDWKLRPNLTLSYGLRFETQSNISDHADFAPRVAIAWGIGRGKSTPKTVLRAGFGMFYDRFSMGNVLTAQQLDGVHQQQFVVNATGNSAAALALLDMYPVLPSIASLSAFKQSQSIYRIDPNLHTPYMMQAAVTVERQISKTATLAVNYIATRGLHQMVTNNVNAPVNGALPDPAAGPIYEFQSNGIFKQQQLMFIPNITISSNLSLHAFYTLGWANGTPNRPSDPYNLMADYGRSMFDVRQRFMVMGTISLPKNFRLNPMIMASSGRPFNITVGQDLNGDSVINDRPSFADPTNTSAAYLANVVKTRWGTFNTRPLPGETIIPVNYGDGPGMFTVGMRVSKTFAIGKRREVAADRGDPNRPFGGPGGPGGDHGPRGGGDRGPGGPGGGGFRGGAVMVGGMGGGRGGPAGRYSLTISADARNLLNTVNLGNPIGNLNSPIFGTSNSIMGGFGGPGGFGGTSANRRISFQAMFTF